MKNIIKDYYQQQHLADDVMDKLLNDGAAHRKPPFYLSRLSVAAMIILTFFVATLATVYVLKPHSLMINEIALNHQHEFEPDVMSSDITTISQRMKRLPFTVNIPGRIPDNYQLIGARYCSIEGQLAVHIKLLNQDNNQRASLFITPLNDSLNKRDSLSMPEEDMTISYWPEQSAFYVFVEDFL